MESPFSACQCIEGFEDWEQLVNPLPLDDSAIHRHRITNRIEKHAWAPAYRWDSYMSVPNDAGLGRDQCYIHLKDVGLLFITRKKPKTRFEETPRVHMYRLSAEESCPLPGCTLAAT